MNQTQQQRHPDARTYRFNSSFFKTFIAVLALIVLLLGAFSVYTLQSENDNLQKNAESSYLNMLKTTGSATELTLQSLQQLMNQTIWNKDFTNAIILPTTNDYTRTSSIITTLHQIAADYPYVSKAFLYIPPTDTVYSSDLSYLPADQMNDAFFADTSALVYFTGARLNNDRESLFVLKSEDRIFLCQHLYPDYLDTIGVLIFELNLNLLDLSITQNADEETNTCYVFDPNVNSIFSSEVPGNVIEQARYLSGRDALHEGILEPDGDFLYFYYRSDATNWLYIYPTSTKDFYSTLSLEKVLFFACAVLLLGLIFSFQVASRANRPIRSLLNELSTTNLDPIEAKDEIDYLTQAYHYTTAQNLQLHEAIQSIAPLALERLFSDILSERAPMPESIDATLKSLGYPIPPQSHFMALDLEISSKTGAELSAWEMNLHILQLRSLFAQSLPESYSSYLIAREETFVAAILVLPPQADEGSVQTAITELYKKLESLRMTTPYQLQIGCGNIYTRMKDVRYSYLDAQKDLNRRRFYGSEEAPPAERLPSHNRYFNQTRQMFRHIQNKQPELAMELAGNLTASIRSEYPVPADALIQYTDFVHTILEITDALHIGNTDELSFRSQSLQEQMSAVSDILIMEEMIRNFCEEAIGSTERKNRTKASQHIVRIQEYIHANYSNSSLSLYMAAEQVGISPSYLSRLFKQEMGASFVDYINSVRVDKAMALLESSDLRIKDIAFQTGFNSMQNFFRIFKKHTGIAPGEYRQNRTGTGSN